MIGIRIIFCLFLLALSSACRQAGQLGPLMCLPVTPSKGKSR